MEFCSINIRTLKKIVNLPFASQYPSFDDSISSYLTYIFERMDIWLYPNFGCQLEYSKITETDMSNKWVYEYPARRPPSSIRPTASSKRFSQFFRGILSRLLNSRLQQIEASCFTICSCRYRRTHRLGTWIRIEILFKRNFWWMRRNRKKIEHPSRTPLTTWIRCKRNGKG